MKKKYKNKDVVVNLKQLIAEGKNELDSELRLIDTLKNHNIKFNLFSYGEWELMIYTSTTKKALKLCFEVHKNQVNKSGMPYVFHPFHLAEQMTDENTTVVALLHDVVEDTDYTIEDLRNMDFNEEILEAISLMTHSKDVPYIAEIKKNPIAKNCKTCRFKT